MVFKFCSKPLLALTKEAEKISGLNYDGKCDRYDFILKAMKAIEKENKNLHSEIERRDNASRMNTINQMLTGELATDNTDILNKCNIHPSSPYMIMGLIHYVMQDSKGTKVIIPSPDLKEEVSDLAKNLIGKKENAFFTEYKGHFIFAIFWQENNSTLKLFEEIEQKANEYAKAENDTIVKLAISEIHTFLKGLDIPYKELMFCLKHIDSCDKNIIYYEKLTKDPFMMYNATKLANSRYKDRTINMPSANETSEAITKYIDAHYGDYTLDVSNIAKLVSLHPNYLSGLFKKQTGFGILSYITNVRIENAKRLLKESNLSIDLIAQRVGYTNSHTFTRAFKKHEGITPTKFRKGL